MRKGIDTVTINYSYNAPLYIQFVDSASSIIIMEQEKNQNENRKIFQQLNPDKVLQLVENAAGQRCNNLFRPLNSYINRVFELQTVSGEGLIVKFYRPGRWSEEAILEEHEFLFDLAERDVAVIAPGRLQDGSSLTNADGMFFSLFPKCGGRSVDEFSDDQWLQLGRLIGRMHLVGKMKDANHRVILGPDHSARLQLAYLLQSRCVPEDIKDSLEKSILAILDDIRPFFTDFQPSRIHGDCHFANIIDRPGESLFLIDFDDMVMGPPVQDIWMLLPGALDEALVEVDLFLEGYETFLPFDRRSFQLVEPLRALRFIHYMAWCACQVEEDGNTRALDGFGTREYWQQEIADLDDQRKRIMESDNPFFFTGNR